MDESAGSQHFPVLLAESVSALVTDPSAVYVDGTFGRGGHSRAILAKLNSDGQLLAFDKDPAAIAVAQDLAEQDKRVQVEHQSFAEIETVARQRGLVGQVHGVLLDLGVSSPQLDNAQRGFSFMHDGPLDMRMDPTRGISAAEWVATSAESEIVRVLKEYGEERFARRIAGAIVEERLKSPILTTRQLAEIVKTAHPRWERDKHPATKTFQAIRIEINSELSDLEKALDAALSVLRPGGRLAVISFHSLEDRLVKRFFKLKAQGKQYPKEVWVTQEMVQLEFAVIGKAVRASDQELQKNNRSRSAIMRVAEKLTPT